MENINWDSNDWQGKRKDQVEYSNMVTFYTVVIAFVIAIIVTILTYL